MNSLTMEIYGGYSFGMFAGCAPYLYELKPEEIVFTEPQKEQIQMAAAAKQSQQMTLFE